MLLLHNLKQTQITEKFLIFSLYVFRVGINYNSEDCLGIISRPWRIDTDFGAYLKPLMI